jgi:hypothetical protein
VRPLLPPATELDLCDGVCWVSVVGLRMGRVSIAGLLHLGDFLETNVRTYAVDGRDRCSTVFLTMEASTLPFVLSARIVGRLPYTWSSMGLRRAGNSVDYRLSRRWPAPAGVGIRWRVRLGERIAPTPLDHHLTARWAQHSRWYGGVTLYTPVEHEPWLLHAAELLDLHEDGLFAAAGLPGPTGPPSSVRYAPEVHARFGLPRTADSRPCAGEAAQYDQRDGEQGDAREQHHERHAEGPSDEAPHRPRRVHKRPR